MRNKTFTKLVENINKVVEESVNFKRSSYDSKIKDIVGRNMFDSKEIIDKVFELYKPIFRETDSMPEFNKYKNDFSKKFSSRIEDMFDMMSSKKADKDDVVDFIQKNIKDFLPYSESIIFESSLEDLKKEYEKVIKRYKDVRDDMKDPALKNSKELLKYRDFLLDKKDDLEKELSKLDSNFKKISTN